MTKSKQAQADAIAALTAAGFEAAGATAQQQVRIPTVRSPVFGGVGGELTTFGGRPRFVKPGTTLRATIGPISTCFYDVIDGKTEYRANLSTKDIAAIKAFVDGNGK